MAEIAWTDEAKKRLERVPQGFMRNMSQLRIESFALKNGVNLVTLEVAEEAIGEARKIMGGMMGTMSSPRLYRCKLCGYTSEGLPESCPVCGAGRDRFELIDKTEAKAAPELKWTTEAMERLKKIPEGFMRDMTKWRIEKMARDKGLSEVTPDVMQEKYDYWGQGSANVQRRFQWTKGAEEKIERIPLFVRGMVIKEIELLAEKKGLKEVSLDLIEESKNMWKGTMEFHSSFEGKEEKKGQ